MKSLITKSAKEVKAQALCCAKNSTTAVGCHD